MKVVAFNGSPRKDGNTATLLKTVCAALENEGIGTELVQLGGRPIHGCRACYRCMSTKDGRCAMDDDPLNEYLGMMAQADGILIGSPTYFADVTAETKCLIDRAGFAGRGHGTLFTRKVGAAVVSMRRAGAIHAFDTINHFFTINEMIVVGSSYWNVGIGQSPNGVGADDEGIHTMRTLGKNMAWVLKKTGGR